MDSINPNALLVDMIFEVGGDEDFTDIPNMTDDELRRNLNSLIFGQWNYGAQYIVKQLLECASMDHIRGAVKDAC